MKLQSGFIQFPLMAWGAIGAGVIILGLGLALKVQSARLEAAQAELSACKIRYSEVLGQISRQNQAIEGWQKAEAEARERAAKAAKAADRFLEAFRGTMGELEQARKSKPVTSCPAGEAVKFIREGLQK